MGSMLPGGSWIKSARQISMKGTLVCADLKRVDKTWARDCTHAVVGDTLEIIGGIGGEIADVEIDKTFDNADGKFRAVVPKMLPGGTWYNSARNTTMDGNLLCTELQRMDRSWIPACMSTEIGQALVNVDGRLALRVCATDGSSEREVEQSLFQ